MSIEKQEPSPCNINNNGKFVFIHSSLLADEELVVEYMNNNLK